MIEYHTPLYPSKDDVQIVNLLPSGWPGALPGRGTKWLFSSEVEHRCEEPSVGVAISSKATKFLGIA